MGSNEHEAPFAVRRTPPVCVVCGAESEVGWHGTGFSIWSCARHEEATSHFVVLLQTFCLPPLAPRDGSALGRSPALLPCQDASDGHLEPPLEGRSVDRMLSEKESQQTRKVRT